MELFIGIDVSKNYLDIYIKGISKESRILNTKQEIKKWIKELKNLTKTSIIKSIVCEATGGYENLIVEFLKKAHLPIHVVHANKVRYFAKTTGRFAKTDKIDAKLLSSYASLFSPFPEKIELSSELLFLQDLIPFPINK